MTFQPIEPYAVDTSSGVMNRPGFRGGSVTWNRPLLGLVFQGSARG